MINVPGRLVTIVIQRGQVREAAGRRVRRLLRCSVPERRSASRVASLTAGTRFAGGRWRGSLLNAGTMGAL